ncbi:MAG: hypothetical protein GEU90_11920 [Gemmatimonas sp.]|nr:hypothetical protein [Gemmatimonas sp.]
MERFLHLAAEGDYLGMGWVFGTAEGPSLESYPAAEVERRMYALAGLVVSESYTIGQGAPQPRQRGNAAVFHVSLTQGGRTLEVPFTAVSGGDGRWFVESVAVEAITDR